MAKLQESEFDLVVSDIRMTGMDGLELFARIKSNRPELTRHFLFITGDAGSPDLNNRIEFLEAPVLRKPFDNRHAHVAMPETDPRRRTQRLRH